VGEVLEVADAELAKLLDRQPALERTEAAPKAAKAADGEGDKA
jgi:hypothetical protein